MNIESPVPHWGGEGVLLASTDGGHTWKEIVEVNGGGGYGAIRFTDLQNGWIAGGTDGKYLYSTHDGGRHWTEIQLPAPPEVLKLFKSGPAAAQYAPPVFKDSKSGVLCVTYFEPGAEAGEVLTALTSGFGERLEYGVGRVRDHGEQRAGRSPRGALALLPVADGLDRHT